MRREGRFAMAQSFEDNEEDSVAGGQKPDPVRQQ
jgi:hypothetical protein